ncbi:MAG: FHA domain-containing protein [Myxococcaceae bacterium]|nr:FHA domain-containing protein [Myxococcaceae bacterium]
MPDQSPPARRRPTSAAAQSVNRPPLRPGGTPHAAVAEAPLPESGAKLVCTAGPRTGTEFPLSGDEEIIIGRATDIAISIPDTSVSRRHCSVRPVGGGWMISDLGSGNGTLVNGERIEAETALRNGDVITIGDTELTFQDIGDVTDRRPIPTRRPGAGRPGAPPPRRSVAGRPDVRARLSRSGAPAMDPAKKRKMMIIGGVVFGVVLIGLIGLKVMAHRRSVLEAEQRAAQEARRRELGNISQEGKNLVREGKWAEAKAKFEEIAQIAPDYPGVQDYIARANIEIPNQQHLIAAEKALSENKLAEAYAELKQVTSDTQQFKQRDELKAKLDSLLRQRLKDVPGLLATVGEKEQRRAAYNEVIAITTDILKVDPENSDADRFKKQAEEAILDLDKPVVVAQGPAPKPWEPVVSRFAAGDMTGALAIADECARKDKTCRRKAKDIREFMGLYKRVEELDARGLNRLLTLDGDISEGRGSPMGTNAGKRAANMFYKNASAAKAAGQWGSAISWAQKTLKADPSHQGAKAIVDEVRSKAKDEYLRCYQMKDTQPDEALTCFKGVLQMCAQGDETWVKTKARIEALEEAR